MHLAMVVYQYNMAEGHYLFENLNRPSNVGLTQSWQAQCLWTIVALIYQYISEFFRIW